MRSLLIATIFFFAISPLQSQERPIPFPAKNNKDTSKSETLWDAAYWKDESGQFHKFGHVQTQLEHVVRDGKEIIRATRVYDLKMTRGRAVFTLDDKQITEESEGKLVRMEYTSSLSRIQKELTALPKGYLISTKTPTENYEDKIGDFPLVGFATELQILKEPRQLEDKFDYYYFEPTLNAAVKVLGKIAGKDRFKSPEGAILEWQRIDLQGAKIGGILPPSASIWVDPKTREIKQTMMEIPGIGYATLVRTTGDQAKAANGKLPDIQANTDIPLSQRVNQIHSLPQMSYRITLEFPIAPGDLLKPSHLHTIVQRQDNLSFELTVKALREPPKNAVKAEPAPPEYLNSCHYITSNDAEVIKLSNTASRGQVNNWDKAQAMESWLNKNFRFVSTKVMDTAAQVANDPNGLSGDCTEVAMLLAAMCRAQGIPSRTAIGVIYADNPKPHFAFHMWTEIYIQGTWLGLDATLGRGSVGPGHIKVTDASWEGERGQTPLMPVMQFIGKHPKIEVLKN